MNKVYLNWVQCAYDNLPYHENTYFYSFSQKGKLVYIGIAYYQDIVTEIKHTLNEFNCGPKHVKIWLGYISSTFGRISEKIVKETESALIYANQPNWNVHHRNSCRTRNNFKIYNTGCHLIIPEIICVDEEMIVIQEQI